MNFTEVKQIPMKFRVEYTIVDGEYEYRDHLEMEIENSTDIVLDAVKQLGDNFNLNDEERADLGHVLGHVLASTDNASGQVGYIEIENGERMLTDFTINTIETKEKSDSIPAKWETILSTANSERTRRMPVIGGWIFCFESWIKSGNGANGTIGSFSTSIAFIPDPDHEWEI